MGSYILSKLISHYMNSYPTVVIILPVLLLLLRNMRLLSNYCFELTIPALRSVGFGFYANEHKDKLNVVFRPVLKKKQCC